MARRKDLAALLDDTQDILADDDGTVAASGLDGMIEQYKRLKPILALIVPMLGKLPFFAKLAPILTLLMTIVDSFGEPGA